MSTPAALVAPMLALILWTLLVLGLIPIARFAAGRRRQVTVDDFRYGESANVPPAVALPNRNLMNLLETPVVFYALCLSLVAIGGATPTAAAWAWGYVALRVVHSLIHLTYNRVLHRLAAFAASIGVLIVLWALAVAQMMAR